MADFMASRRIRFTGSDYHEAQRCFTVGKLYHADCTSAGNYLIVDNFGTDWHIDGDDDDFEVVE